MYSHRLFTALTVLTLAGIAQARAEDRVFDQPGVEVRISATDLAPRINTVVEGIVTAVNGEAGAFSVSGRRVLFQSSREDQPPVDTTLVPAEVVQLPPGIRTGAIVLGKSASPGLNIYASVAGFNILLRDTPRPPVVGDGVDHRFEQGPFTSTVTPQPLPPVHLVPPPNLAQTMPAAAASHPCVCTRIVVQAPMVGNGAGTVAGTGATRAGGAAGEEQSTREPAPILDYKFFPTDHGMTVINSMDLKQPIALAKDNVLHPVEDPDHAKRPWDAACVCDATLVIRPYGDDFTQNAETYTNPRSRTGERVAYEKEPVADPLPPENKRDSILNIKNTPPRAVRALRKGDRVLVGYSSGEVAEPVFVIRAPGIDVPSR